MVYEPLGLSSRWKGLELDSMWKSAAWAVGGVLGCAPWQPPGLPAPRLSSVQGPSRPVPVQGRQQPRKHLAVTEKLRKRHLPWSRAQAALCRRRVPLPLYGYRGPSRGVDPPNSPICLCCHLLSSQQQQLKGQLALICIFGCLCYL